MNKEYLLKTESGDWENENDCVQDYVDSDDDNNDENASNTESTGDETYKMEYRPPSHSPINHKQAQSLLHFIQTRVVDCLGFLEEAKFVFGRVGHGRAKSAEVEAAMIPPGETALTLEVHDDVGGSGRDKMQ
eukprot:scaffold144862_cov66-Cyclotella_meneghiniana.AAC.1